jgi:hypothetical protein
MRAPELGFQSVGVAGFEPTASSSRTAGRSVARGAFLHVAGHWRAFWDGAGRSRCCIPQLYS